MAVYGSSAGLRALGALKDNEGLLRLLRCGYYSGTEVFGLKGKGKARQEGPVRILV